MKNNYRKEFFIILFNRKQSKKATEGFAEIITMDRLQRDFIIQLIRQCNLHVNLFT